MNAKQYGEAIARLGLTQVDAAHFLQSNERTSRRWALGESPVPFDVSALLRLMLHYKVTPEQVEKLPRWEPVSFALSAMVRLMIRYKATPEKVDRLPLP